MMALSSDVEASFNGNVSGSQSSSGSVHDDGSIVNYAIFQQTNVYNNVTASNVTGSTVTYVSLGTFYYNTYTNRTTPISSISQLFQSSVYYITNQSTGDSWYALGTGSSAYRCFPSQITLANSSSDPSLSTNGSFNGTLSGTITMEGELEYPPMFPASNSVVYSYNPAPNIGSKHFTASSEGLTLGNNEKFGFVVVEYNIELTNRIQLPLGSIYMPLFPQGGYPNLVTGNFPTFLANPDTYAVGINYTNLVTITSFQSSLINNSVSLSFTANTNQSYTTYIRLDVVYFTTESVPAFTYDRKADIVNPIYYASDLQFNSSLNDINTSLNSAGGANNGLNNQNNIMGSTLSEYQSETDTSEQYNNISDDLFTFDLSIFTSVASTMTLFNACITSIFTQLGDLAVPLTLFLVLVFVSTVVGIRRIL